MLAQALPIQRRVIGALVRRELLTRYGRHNIGMLWLVLEPMLFTLGVAGAWQVSKLHLVSNIPIIAFALTGYSSVLVWRNSANRCMKAVEVNLGLMYHSNVKVLDIFVARVLLELVGGTTSFALLALVFSATGSMSLPQDMVLVIGGWLLLCWFALALSMVAGVLSERSETFERVWHVATYLFFPLSGAVFMVEWLPRVVQDAVLWLPMVHGVEMVRHGFFGTLVRTHESAFYLLVCDMLLSLVALALVRDAGARVQPQ